VSRLVYPWNPQPLSDHSVFFSFLVMGVGSDVQLLAAISLQWVDLTCARATEVVGDARLEGVISLPSHRPSSVSNMGVERNVRTLVVRKWLADALCTVQR